MTIGKIFITRNGYDPELGKHVKDPYLGPNPSLGACRPDLRKQLAPGDFVFTVSGKVPEANQFVMGTFEVESKIPATLAHKLVPEQRLHRIDDGQVSGNIIVTARGKQHRLDDHERYERRIPNYILGKNCIALIKPGEIAIGRAETLEVLSDLLKKKGAKPIDVIGRWGCSLSEKQALQLRDWMRSIKRRA